jgi:hypothetical protein
MLTADLVRVKRLVKTKTTAAVGYRSQPAQRSTQAGPAACYFLPFLAFFGGAFFEGVGFFAIAFAPPRLPENADSQPSEYF